MRRRRRQRRRGRSGTAESVAAEMLTTQFLANQLTSGFSPPQGHGERGGLVVGPSSILGFVLNLLILWHLSNNRTNSQHLNIHLLSTYQAPGSEKEKAQRVLALGSKHQWVREGANESIMFSF